MARRENKQRMNFVNVCPYFLFFSSFFFDFFFGRREKSRTFMALNLDPAETKRSGERERDKWPSPIKRTVERPFRCPNGRYTARKGRERIIRNGPQNTREGTKPWHWYKEKTAREQHVDIRASKRREDQPNKKKKQESLVIFLLLFWKECGFLPSSSFYE